MNRTEGASASQYQRARSQLLNAMARAVGIEAPLASPSTKAELQSGAGVAATPSGRWERDAPSREPLSPARPRGA